MSKLADQEFVPCRGDIPPLAGAELADLHSRLGDDWEVADGHHLEKTFRFEDFAQALAFANQIGELADRLGHHPDLHVSWGKLKVLLWTHAIDGLAEADFVLAAKIDRLARKA